MRLARGGRRPAGNQIVTSPMAVSNGHGTWNLLPFVLQNTELTMLKTAFIGVLLSVFVARAGEPATISHHTSEVPLDGLYYYVDMDQDGTFDYFFWGYTVVSTYPDYPATMQPQLSANAFNGNDYLTDTNGNIQQEPAGRTFGPDTSPGQVWGQIGSELPLLSSGSGDVWSGFGGEPPECFIGLRFNINGQPHYGWIRLLVPTRQPSQSALTQGTVFPVVADWAYETRPNTPIRAGAVGTNNEPVVFTVDFENPDGTLNGSDIRRSTGSLIWDGETLHYEMVLDGSHTNLDIFAANNSKPQYDLMVPPSGLPGFPTYLLGGFKPSRSEIAQILCGKSFVSVDQGSMLGWIVPADKRNRSCGDMDWRHEARKSDFP